MKVLIIEDEHAAAKRLMNMLHEIDETIEIQGVTDTIVSSLEWLESNQEVDLLFMDIHLADGSSFKIFDHIDIQKPIIFTTAYDQYAIEAFRVNALDYLLKPIKKAELQIALQKYTDRMQRAAFDYRELAQSLLKEEPAKRFLIKVGQSYHVVDILDVAYFYTHDKITFLVTNQGKRYPIEYSLEKLDELVDSKLFFRINRQFIINYQAIHEMHAYSKSRVKIVLDPACKIDSIVSTERSPVFKRWITGDLESSEV